MRKETDPSPEHRPRAGRRRIVDRPVLFGCLIVVVVMLMIVTMPVWMPILGLSMARDERRQRREISRIACERCGTILGPDALDRGSAVWSAYVARLHQERPGIRFRLNRTIFAVCGACGAQYDYDRGTSCYRLLASADEYAVPEVTGD